jgi:anti-sigma B factor antagonist
VPALRPGELRVDHAAGRQRHVLALAGELDLTTAPTLLVLVTQICRRGGPTQALLDLRELGFMDSAGLRAVLRSAQLCRDSGLEFSLVCDPNGACSRLFTVAGVGDRLAVRDSMPPDEEPAAIESVLGTPMLSGGTRASRLVIRTGARDAAPVVALAGELEEGTSPVLLATVRRMCHDGAREITLDLAELVRVGAGCSEMVTTASQVCEESGAALRIVPPSAQAARAALDGPWSMDGPSA